MKSIMIKLAVCCCLMHLSACYKTRENSFKSQSEMIGYISDERNGLSMSYKSQENIETSIRFQPYESILGYEKRDNMLFNNIYFIMSFSAHGKELLHQLSQEQYSAFSQLFSFSMQNHVKGKSDVAELEPSGVFYSPTYNMGKANNLLLVFDRDAALHGEHFEIVVDEFGLGIGSHSYSFNTETLKEARDFKLIN